MPTSVLSPSLAAPDRPRAAAPPRPVRRRRAVVALSSVRLTVVLLLALAALAAVGTAIPQGHPAEVYTERFGERTAAAIRRFGLDEVYGGPVFLGLLAALVVNVAACTIVRFRATPRGLLAASSHLALVLLIVGGGVSAISRERGMVEMAGGETVSRFLLASGETRPLPFSLQRLDGGIEYGERVEHVLEARSLRPRGEAWLRLPDDLAGGGGLALGTTAWRLRLLQYEPEFARAEGVPAEVRAIEALHGPAAKIAVIGPDGEADVRWIFADKPHLEVNARANPAVATRFRIEREIRNRWSELKLRFEDGTTRRARVAVNDPLRIAGFSISQAEGGPSDRSILGITRDPGTAIVFVAFALFVASSAALTVGRARGGKRCTGRS